MLTKLKKKLKRNPLFWYHVVNRNVGKSYEKPTGVLNDVVENLYARGIAKARFEDVFEGISFSEFKNKVDEAVREYEAHGKTMEHDEKYYMNFVLGLEPSYDSASAWAKVAEHPNLKKVANAYFRMSRTEMRYYNIWKHEKAIREASGSQLWHRDREDVKILKVFVCMEDVDATKGPFTYAPGTHLEGRVKQEPDFFLEKSGTRRTTDAMMDKVVPKTDWVYSVGKAGDVVFADTNGYHKGGEVAEGYRLLFTCMYVSPGCGRVYFK